MDTRADHTLSTQATTPQERADALFDALSSLLRHAPESPDDAIRALRNADQAFDALHTWLRAGNPLPQPWNTRPRGHT